MKTVQGLIKRIPFFVCLPYSSYPGVGGCGTETLLTLLPPHTGCLSQLEPCRRSAYTGTVSQPPGNVVYEASQDSFEGCNFDPCLLAREPRATSLLTGREPWRAKASCCAQQRPWALYILRCCHAASGIKLRSGMPSGPVCRMRPLIHNVVRCWTRTILCLIAARGGHSLSPP